MAPRLSKLPSQSVEVLDSVVFLSPLKVLKRQLNTSGPLSKNTYGLLSNCAIRNSILNVIFVIQLLDSVYISIVEISIFVKLADDRAFGSPSLVTRSTVEYTSEDVSISSNVGLDG